MPGGIQRGTGEIDKENERAAKMGGGRFTPALNIESGGHARIRILDGPITYYGHRINDQGKKRTYYRYCNTFDDDSSEVCGYCDNGVKWSRFFLFWIWVHVKLHPKADSDGKWEKVKYRGKDYYQERVNRPMLLRRGMGRGNSMYDKFANCYLEYGEWDDRDYIWSRNMAVNWQDTDYSLTPKDPTELSKVLTKIAGQLADLGEVATEKSQGVPRFDNKGNIFEGDEKKAGDEEAPAKKKKKPAPMPKEEIEDEDDEDDDDMPF